MKTVLDRRDFLGLITGAVAGTVARAVPVPAAGAHGLRLQAVAFDAFAIFDPRPIVTLAEELFPGKGSELSNLWRTRQFEYTWIRTAAGRYEDFLQVTEDGLIFAARTLKLDLEHQMRSQLMDAYSNLGPWPDVPEAMRSLKAAGLRLALLSNNRDHAVL